MISTKDNIQNIWGNSKIIEVLENNGVVVMPTDTLYGIVGKAENDSVVNTIYTLRKRAPHKPCIILIGDPDELKKFSITISNEQKKVLDTFWNVDLVSNHTPEATSIILDCKDEKFIYLHRGTETLAFRLPAQKGLRELLQQTGPLVAPSANLEGLPPARNIPEAKKYFGNSIDMYVDGGEVKGKASKVIKVDTNGVVTVIRP